MLALLLAPTAVTDVEALLLTGPELLLMADKGGLSRPTSTTSMLTIDDEHLLLLASVSLSPLLEVVRFCGDNADWVAEFSEGGGGRPVSGEFVAEAFEDEVDVEDMELATVICGCIEANVCGDMRDKCGDKWARDICGCPLPEPIEGKP